MSSIHLPILCSGPPMSGLNLLSVLLDDHPEIFSGPPMNLFGHADLWREDATADVDVILDTKSRIYCNSIWGAPSSRNMAYYFLSLPDLRFILGRSSDIANLTKVIYEPRLLVEKVKYVFDVSPSNVFSARAALERGTQLVFLLRDPLDSIARQPKSRIRPVFAAIYWFIQATVAVRLRVAYGGSMVHIIRYEDMVSAPDRILTDVFSKLQVKVRDFGVARRERTLRRRTDTGLVGSTSMRNWRHKPFDDLQEVMPGSDQDTVSHRFLHCLFGLTTSQALEALAPGGSTTAYDIARILGYDIPEKFARLPALKEEEKKPQNPFEEFIMSLVNLKVF